MRAVTSVHVSRTHQLTRRKRVHRVDARYARADKGTDEIIREQIGRGTMRPKLRSRPLISPLARRCLLGQETSIEIEPFAPVDSIVNNLDNTVKIDRRAFLLTIVLK